MPLDKYVQKNIYYMNISELEKIAKKYDLYTHIYIQKDDGTIKRTSERDVKMNIIKRILQYLKNGQRLKATIYPKTIIKRDRTTNELTSKSYIYYGQYKNGDKNIISIMSKLTNNKFFFGAVSCNILRHIWSHGKKITYKEFSKLWIKEINKATKHPEWQYIDFLRHNDKSKWKSTRNKISNKILSII